jgi:MOSC domain-containing protein YiiM
MTGSVVQIFVAAKSADVSTPVSSATLQAGRGIVGDRYYDKDVDAQVTLVCADTIAQVNAESGWTLKPDETRRNIVTRDVDLNQWETARFRIGDVVLEGVELCEPCASLGKILSNDARTPADVVKVLTNRAGLRARVVTGGEIRPGDDVGPA